MARYDSRVQDRSRPKPSKQHRFCSMLTGSSTPSFQFVQDSIDLRGREILVIDVVDHHHRRSDAGGEALLLAFQEYASVGRALARFDAELALDVCDEFLGAA